MADALTIPLYPLEAIRSDAGQVQVRTSRLNGRQGQLVATFYVGHEALEHLPALLVAGPEMLVAMREAISELQDYRSMLHRAGSDITSVDYAIEHMTSALKKARGAA